MSPPHFHDRALSSHMKYHHKANINKRAPPSHTKHHQEPNLPKKKSPIPLHNLIPQLPIPIHHLDSRILHPLKPHLIIQDPSRRRR
jgi:hypothetical protein